MRRRCLGMKRRKKSLFERGGGGGVTQTPPTWGVAWRWGRGRADSSDKTKSGPRLVSCFLPGVLVCLQQLTWDWLREESRSNSTCQSEDVIKNTHLKSIRFSIIHIYIYVECRVEQGYIWRGPLLLWLSSYFYRIHPTPLSHTGGLLHISYTSYKN